MDRNPLATAAIDPELVKRIYDDMVAEAGAEVLFHTQLCAVEKPDGGGPTLVLSSKAGLTACRAKVYVDCTGDADLAAWAGCAFEQGGPTGHSQPMTLCFKLDGVDPERVPPRSEITRLYHEARERGEIDCPREDVLMFGWFEPDVMHFNSTRVIHKAATDGPQLSEAELEGRRQFRELFRFLRAHAPGR